MKIQIEPFSIELSREILPLAQKCWKENTALKGESCAFYGERDFEVDPNLEQYQVMARAEVLVIVTLRDEGVLKGYAIGILYRSPHHQKILAGNGDSIYIEPEFRASAAVLVRVVEDWFRDNGAQIIGWATHLNSPMYEVLKARGYVGDDIVMEKRLCVLS